MAFSQGIIIPWMIIGDFNDIMELNERVGRKVHKRISGNFKECVNACGLLDLKFSGCY